MGLFSHYPACLAGGRGMLNSAVSIGEILRSLAHRERLGRPTRPLAADRLLGALCGSGHSERTQVCLPSAAPTCPFPSSCFSWLRASHSLSIPEPPRIHPIPVFLPRSFAPPPPSGQTGAPGLGWGLFWLGVRIMINPLCGVGNPGWKAGSDGPRGGPHGLSGHAERWEPISAADRWPGRTRGWGPVSGRGGGVQDPGPPPRACPPTQVLRTVVILGLPTSLLL